MPGRIERRPSAASAPSADASVFRSSRRRSRSFRQRRRDRDKTFVIKRRQFCQFQISELAQSRTTNNGRSDPSSRPARPSRNYRGSWCDRCMESCPGQYRSADTTANTRSRGRYFSKRMRSGSRPVAQNMPCIRSRCDPSPAISSSCESLNRTKHLRPQRERLLRHFAKIVQATKRDETRSICRQRPRLLLLAQRVVAPERFGQSVRFFAVIAIRFAWVGKSSCGSVNR